MILVTISIAAVATSLVLVMLTMRAVQEEARMSKDVDEQLLHALRESRNTLHKLDQALGRAVASTKPPQKCINRPI